MSDPVRVTSIDALEAFRSELVQYLAKARVALEEVEGEVRRTRTWLDHDCSRHWQGRIRAGGKRLEQAEQELYSANLTSPKASNAFQKMAVLKARRELAEAEEKARLVKHWRQAFEPRVTPLLRQLDPLHHLLGQELPKGVHFLGEAIRALQAYAERPVVTRPPKAEGGAA